MQTNEFNLIPKVKSKEKKKKAIKGLIINFKKVKKKSLPWLPGTIQPGFVSALVSIIIRNLIHNLLNSSSISICVIKHKKKEFSIKKEEHKN